MGISVISSGGISSEEVVEFIEDYLVELPLQIGTENAGVIIHNSPGVSKDGTNISAQYWVEIYGEQIHFSKT